MIRWSSRSLGSSFQHRVFYWLVRCRALVLARALLRVVVFYYTLLPGVRRRCRPYLRRRFPGARGAAMFGHAYSLYLNFGQALLDRSIAGITGSFPIQREGETVSRLRGILAEGRGCIVLTAHLGGWQLGLAALEALGTPVHVVQRRDPGDVDKHYFEHGGGRVVRLIDASRPLETALAASMALRRNELVCMMGDRMVDEAASARVSFLGGIIAVPLTAYALASITGAPLALVFSVRGQDGMTRPHWSGLVRIPPGLGRNAAQLRPFALRFAAALEEMARLYPQQFFNFYDMWADDNDTRRSDREAETDHCRGSQPGRPEPGRH